MCTRYALTRRLGVYLDWDQTTILRKRDPAKAKVTRSDTEINAARRVRTFIKNVFI